MIVLVGLAGAFLYIRRRNNTAPAAPPPLNPEEREELRRLIDADGGG